MTLAEIFQYILFGITFLGFCYVFVDVIRAKYRFRQRLRQNNNAEWVKRHGFRP